MSHFPQETINNLRPRPDYISEEVEGLCRLAEPRWLTYLSLIYLGITPANWYELIFDTDKSHKTLALKKTSVKGQLPGLGTQEVKLGAGSYLVLDPTYASLPRIIAHTFYSNYFRPLDITFTRRSSQLDFKPPEWESADQAQQRQLRVTVVAAAQLQARVSSHDQLFEVISKDLLGKQLETQKAINSATVKQNLKLLLSKVL